MAASRPDSSHYLSVQGAAARNIMQASSAHLGSDDGYGLGEPSTQAGMRPITESNFRPKSPDY